MACGTTLRLGEHPGPFPVEAPMAKPELGTKRICVACNTKFYDLTKTPAVCPKCSTEQPAEQPRMRRAGGNVPEDKRRAKIAPVPGVEDADLDVVADADDVEEDVLEDTSDLEDGDDAIAEVEVEVETGDEER
jgi:uncharacterized protein (TIGR02300 family)